MTRVIRPQPLKKEIILDPNKVIMSKTDAKGVILYANEYFMEISGYKEHELMGQQHNVIRHPDMPRVIFLLLWQKIQAGENVHAIVKNLAKDGSFYWVVTNFEARHDASNNIIAYYSRRKAAPRMVIEKMEKLYKILLALEKDDRTMKRSIEYLKGLLEEEDKAFNTLILEMLGLTETELQSYFRDPNRNLNVQREERSSKDKKGFFARFFKNPSLKTNNNSTVRT